MVEKDVFPAVPLATKHCEAASVNERTIWLRLVSSRAHHRQQRAMRQECPVLLPMPRPIVHLQGSHLPWQKAQLVAVRKKRDWSMQKGGRLRYFH